MTHHVWPVRTWRAKDRHTGVGKDRGIPYTYKHHADRRPPSSRAEIYRIETFIPFVAPTPIHVNVHYVPGAKLDRFFDRWDEHAETVTDIRPMTFADAIAEIDRFKADAGGEPRPVMGEQP